MTLTVGSLFAGIGGIDLGLERAGMKVLWQVEIDEWCRAVLAKHWPDVERFEDVRDCSHLPPGAFGGRRYRLPRVDLIAGGFPCQDISQAGRGTGISGSRSGLWRSFARIVGELRPRYVLVENVPLLRSRGLEVVLADLAACGYDAEWDCIPAATLGAPHLRDRFWLLAYRQDDASRPNANGTGSYPAPLYLNRSFELRDKQISLVGQVGWWGAEPAVGRVADGVPGYVDRLRGLGNAVVPQVVEWIGRRIVEAEAEVAA